MTRQPTPNIADVLNHTCFCRTLNQAHLHSLLEKETGLAGLADDIAQSRPHLFSDTVVFLSGATVHAIAQAVGALDRVMAHPAYVAQALAHAPGVAQHSFGPKGVFTAFDFHISPQGPRLIEINTNGGGAWLNAPLARAQQSCCEAMDWVFNARPAIGNLEDQFVAMFQAEWRSQRGHQPLCTVAIVDDAPAQQYLRHEFALCQRALQQQGLQALIVDPSDLNWDGQRLHAQGLAVDLVYNRLTDFDLSEAPHLALRQAYEAGGVVLTPNPRAHALLAHKRNLIPLSNATTLAQWGVSEADRQVLGQVVPATCLVTADAADALWAERRHWFFKPVAGYGSKGAYRGDKLTKRVWAEIVAGSMAGGFVAQALVPPDERLVDVAGTTTDLKFDVRAYAYQGQVQLLAARMYEGQTTNFRTPGGGFAPVVEVG